MNSIKKRDYQQCSRCVMDTTASEIVFDEDGVCNFCTVFLRRSSHIIFEESQNKEARLKKLIADVKSSGEGKQYDCIVGVSGGVDSSWTLAEAKRLGLRPLAVHMDNGWNSELAQNNIANLVQSLNIDLYTYVIDWTEYRELMQAFFDSDVIDVELLYDNAALAVNYQQAARYGIKYILAGTNQATEGMPMPKAWNWFKFDKRNIYAIARQHGMKKIDTYPAIGIKDRIWFHFINGIRWTSFLDYVPYKKFQAIDELEKLYGYKQYPFKHYESIFTRFYQGYLLPKKFGIDKRKLHLATLVVSGQMTREDALNSLEGVPYLTDADLQADVAYFLKKMKWTQQQLVEYIGRPEVSHAKYLTERPTWDLLSKIYRKIL